MVLNSRHNFAKITKIVDHATLGHTASLLTVLRTIIFTVARLYENLSGPSELRTLNQNLSSSQFQSPAPSPSPAMRRAESELCTMWLQTGSCSAAMRGLCTRAHSLNELSSPRPSPHTSYFNVSGLEILVNIIITPFISGGAFSTQSLQDGGNGTDQLAAVAVRGGSVSKCEEASEDGDVCELQQLWPL